MTYSVAEPVFILVPGVAVVHVHSFAMDGQTFLKEEDKIISGFRGWFLAAPKEQVVLEGREGGEGTPPPSQIAFLCQRQAHVMYAWCTEDSKGVWDPNAQTVLEQSGKCDPIRQNVLLSVKPKDGIPTPNTGGGKLFSKNSQI